jgi:competence protein ComGC
MRSLAGLVSILVVALIAGLFYKFYFSQSTGGGTPAQTINVVGVKSDLIAIAQAERAYQAEHNSYGSLDDLVSSGALSMKKSGRDGYLYDASGSGDNFRATALCPAATNPGCTNYTIDQTMEVQSAP